MSLARFILPLFIIIPIIEVMLFVIAGDAFGAGPTLLMIVLTAIIGVHFLKQQGANTFLRFQEKMNKQSLPAQELIEGMILLVCGALLVTPGFFTDIIGFLGLVPAVRHYWSSRLSNRWTVQFNHTSFHETIYRAQQHSNQDQFEHGQSQKDFHSSHGGRTFEGDFQSEDDEKNNKLH